MKQELDKFKQNHYFSQILEKKKHSAESVNVPVITEKEVQHQSDMDY